MELGLGDHPSFSVRMSLCTWISSWICMTSMQDSLGHTRNVHSDGIHLFIHAVCHLENTEFDKAVVITQHPAGGYKSMSWKKTYRLHVGSQCWNHWPSGEYILPGKRKLQRVQHSKSVFRKCTSQLFSCSHMRWFRHSTVEVQPNIPPPFILNKPEFMQQRIIHDLLGLLRLTVHGKQASPSIVLPQSTPPTRPHTRAA